MLSNKDVRRNLPAYCRSTFDAVTRRLAELSPNAQYAEVPGAYVLSMLDEPETVAYQLSDFLR